MRLRSLVLSTSLLAACSGAANLDGGDADDSSAGIGADAGSDAADAATDGGVATSTTTDGGAAVDGSGSGSPVSPAAGTCAANPWANDNGCADALRHTISKGPGTQPVLRWSKNYLPLGDNVLNYSYTTNMRVDARGRLIAQTSQNVGDAVAVFDGLTGAESDVTGGAVLALGAKDTLYECYSDAGRGSVVVALDTTPPLTAPLPQRWKTTIFATGNYGPCGQLVVTDDGLVISQLQGTVTVLSATTGVKRFSGSFVSVQAIAAEGSGPIYVQGYRDSLPDTTPHLVAFDRTTGSVIWEYVYDPSTNDGSFGSIDGDRGLLGATEGGALAYYYLRVPSAASTVFFQNKPGAPAWTASLQDMEVSGAATSSSVFLAGARNYATLDLVTNTMSAPTASGWTLGAKKIIVDSRGYRYVLGDNVGDNHWSLAAFNASGAPLWSQWVGNAHDFTLGADGWLYVATRPGILAYQASP